MYVELSELIEEYLENGLPEKQVLEDKVGSIVGRQVTCYLTEDTVKIRVHVPALFRNIAQRYMDAKEIESKLNGGRSKYSYKCKDVIGGVNISVINSPSQISKIQIVV